MTIVRPFKGVTYNLEKVLLKQVISPPLCLLDKDLNDSFASKSFYNISNLLASADEDKCANVAIKYKQWKNEKVLVKELEPVLYLYEQQFTLNEELLTRTGFVGLKKLKLKDDTSVADIELSDLDLVENFELMKATKSNFNQVLGLYLDNSKRLDNLFADVKKNMPVLSTVDDSGTKNTIWLIKDDETIEIIINFMKDQNILIADSCNSYRTSLKYCKYMRELNNTTSEDIKSYDFAMVTFVNLLDEGTKIFNKARVVTVSDYFDKTDFLNRLKEKFKIIKLDDMPGDHAYSLQMTLLGEEFGLVIEDEVFEKLHPIHRKIDAYVLHKVLIDGVLGIGGDNVEYKLDYIECESVLKNIDDKIVFKISKKAKETVLDVFEYGSSMFGTLVYSYPALQSGLLINEL